MKKLVTLGTIGLLAVSLIGCGNSNDKETKKSDSESSSAKVTKKKDSVSESKKKAEKERQIKDDEKAMKSDLATLPDQSNGLITKAIYKDDSTGYGIELTLSDDVLSMNNAELKNMVNKAWTLGKNLGESYVQFPDDESYGDIVTVLDSSGNKLAHSSSFTHKIKYDL
jgi:uncharacterized protein YlxW (UPF0749 family)